MNEVEKTGEAWEEQVQLTLDTIRELGDIEGQMSPGGWAQRTDSTCSGAWIDIIDADGNELFESETIAVCRGPLDRYHRDHPDVCAFEHQPESWEDDEAASWLKADASGVIALRNNAKALLHYAALGLASESSPALQPEASAVPKDTEAKLKEAVELLEMVLSCDMAHDERGHAYLKVPARSLNDLGAAIRAFLEGVKK